MFPQPDYLRCLSRRSDLCSPVAGAFAFREVANLGQLGRLHLEIHARVDALGMAALAGLGTVISHRRGTGPLGGERFDFNPCIVLDLQRDVPLRSLPYKEDGIFTGMPRC